MSDVRYTGRQIEYLAFISQYRTFMGVSPSEVDIAKYFRVSGPSAHQMVVTLEKKGALERIPGRARSIDFLDSSLELPCLGWADSPLRAALEQESVIPMVAVVEFGDFLARRICAKRIGLFIKASTVIRIANAVCTELERLGAEEEFIDLAREYLESLPWELEKKTAKAKTKRPANVRKEPRPQAERPLRKKNVRDDPRQRSLFEDS